MEFMIDKFIVGTNRGSLISRLSTERKGRKIEGRTVQVSLVAINRELSRPLVVRFRIDSILCLLLKE